MILILLLFLFLLKFDYPSIYLDYLIALILSLCVFSFIFTAYAARKIEAGISCTKKQYNQGEEAELEINVNGIKYHPPIIAVLEERILQRQQSSTIRHLNGGKILINDLSPGTYRVSFKRVLVAGIFRILYYPVRNTQHIEFIVYPRKEAINEDKLRMITLAEDGELINERGNDYSEIYEIREFMHGDNLKYMHRPLSAKYGTYMIKVGSKNEKKLCVYRLEKKSDFARMTRSIGSCLYLFDEYVEKKHSFLCLNYDNEWKLIINEDDLHDFIREVYSEYYC